MKLEWRGRRMGKTTEAIKEAAATGAYILCPTIARAREIAKQAEEMGKQIRFPVALTELDSSRGRNTGFVKDLIIDDLDEVLRQLFPTHRIHMATITAERTASKGESNGR